MNGNLENVPSMLNPLLGQAQDEGRLRTCMEVMILSALYQRAQKNIPVAVDWLSQALGLAAPEGFIRIFLDEGMPLLELLPQARQTAPDLVDVILEKDQIENGSQPSPLAQLPESLTNQKLRVLALIDAGKSNQREQI
jgi:LuxR family maltose regulon positive regulatory protein